MFHGEEETNLDVLEIHRAHRVVTFFLSQPAHMELRVHTHIYIDILHVNLKCYLLTNICQMVILKHCKYLFSIWFSAFFGGYHVYIYILHINLQRRQKSGYDAQQWSYKGWLCKQQASRPRLMGIYRKVPMWFDNVRYIYIYTYRYVYIYIQLYYIYTLLYSYICTYNIHIYIHTV